MEELVFHIQENTKAQLDDYRKLWDDIFADPEGFADYYFENVCANNVLLGAYIGDELVGMVHANPYQILDALNDELMDSYYIVGVAVKEAYRKQKIMRKMMLEMMRYLSEKKIQFLFLMPENQNYYLSLGFEHIYHTKTITLDCMKCVEKVDNFKENKMVFLSDFSKDDLRLLAQRVNEWLAGRYLYFSKRTIAYFEHMLMEHQCQGGDVVVVYNDKTITGIFAYGLDEDTMYVERLEIVDANCFDSVLCTILDVVKLNSKKKCVITMDEVFEKQLSDSGFSDMEMETGHGIMACTLDNNLFSIKNLKNKCFFDEIV